MCNKFLSICLLLAQISFAQFQIGAKLEPVLKSGSYRIVLPTKMASASEQNFSDLRIFDSNKNEVPYFIFNDVSLEKVRKIDFKIVSQSTEFNKKSNLIFENPNLILDYINVEVANYSGSKTFVVSGSNNNKDWFGVLRPTNFDNLEGNDLSVFIKLSFPKTNYAFLKIETIDKNSLPINILAINKTTTDYTANNYQNVIPKSLQIKQFSKEKKTRVFVEFQDIELINKLQFNILSPSNYSRKIYLMENISKKLKRKTVISDHSFADIELTPITNKNLLIDQKRTKKLTIEIDNLDNQPLDIRKVNFYQKSVTVVAALEANEKYTIKTKNSNALKPAYDVSNIETLNVNNLPLLKVLEVTQIKTTATSNATKPFWNSPVFLWTCISIAALATLFFVNGFLKDLKKEER